MAKSIKNKKNITTDEEAVKKQLKTYENQKKYAENQKYKNQ